MLTNDFDYFELCHTKLFHLIVTFVLLFAFFVVLKEYNMGHRKEYEYDV